MKRFEKYAAQQALLQEAAFVITRRQGPHALTRRRLAAELGASEAMARRTLADHVSLPRLAAAECVARRGATWHRRPYVDRLLPDAEDLDVEIVWLRLRLAHGVVPAHDEGADLASRYQLATRGFVDGPAATDEPQPSPPSPPSPPSERDLLATYLTEHAQERRSLATALLTDRADLVEPLLAMADGLVLAMATGRLTQTDARSILIEHLRAAGVVLDGG